MRHRPAIPAAAKLKRLEIATRQSYGTFRPGEFVLLLPEDQAIIIQSAAESPLWRAPPMP
jgi:hypothetical protein